MPVEKYMILIGGEWRGAPLQGQHGAEILKELGLDQESIAELAELGVV
jgi:crotonobetainyl-CoA:carnitine CoA-transferase CaiB-like acyl-CoA transferase